MSAAISDAVGQDDSVPGRVTAIAAAASASFEADVTDSPLARPPARQPQNTSPAPLVSSASTCGAGKRSERGWSWLKHKTTLGTERDHDCPCAFGRERFGRCRHVTCARQCFRLAVVHHQHVRQTKLRRSRGIDRAGIQNGSRAIFPCGPQASVCRGALQVSLHDKDVARRNLTRKRGLDNRIERLAAGDATDDEVFAASINDDGRAVARQIEFDCLEIG